MTYARLSHSAFPERAPSARPSFDAAFSYGFRPFFLGAAVYAALAMGLWICWLAGAAHGWTLAWLPIGGSAVAWHAHEMVFGFAAAAIGGFLLTAVPNWTGALPISGLPLVLLFAAWLVGRVAMGVSALLPYPVVMVLDVLFLPVLGAFAARQLFVRPALRNLVFLVLVAALTLANVLFHLGMAGMLAVDPLWAVRCAVLLVILMIAIIGGRIIPAFTHNWLNVRRTSPHMPKRIPRLDVAALASLAAFVLLAASSAPDLLLGTVALVAAATNGARLVLWRGFATRAEPIVWVLHLGYAWIVAGLALAALAAFTGLVPSAMVSHAFGTGAIGTMIIAVMSRASLGHTGRPLVAPRTVVWAYHLVTLSAVLRVAAPAVAPDVAALLLTLAGGAWIGAFVLFARVYAPILTTPRVHTKLEHARRATAARTSP